MKRREFGLALGGSVAGELMPQGRTVALFNGRDLEGWVHEGGRATFSAVEGEIRTTGAGNFPNWLRTEREYENFRLRFEYRLERWAQAGVYLRAPRGERPARCGIGIVLAHDFHAGVVDDHVTGAIFGVAAPARTVAGDFGTWHRVEITLDGARLRVAIDGVVTQDCALGASAALGHRAPRGYLGFPDLGHAWAIRNVELEELDGRAKSVELFDGRTLTGYELRGGGVWSVREGSLSGANGDGILYAPGVFGDFDLHLSVRTHHHVNSGIFLRGDAAGARRGFEIQVYSPPDAVDYTTGSIYGKVRARPVADHDERWLQVKIRLEGRRCAVWLDGELVAECVDFPEEKAGRIGFQIHGENSQVEYRDMRVYPR